MSVQQSAQQSAQPTQPHVCSHCSVVTHAVDLGNETVKVSFKSTAQCDNSAVQPVARTLNQALKEARYQPTQVPQTTSEQARQQAQNYAQAQDEDAARHARVRAEQDCLKQEFAQYYAQEQEREQMMEQARIRRSEFLASNNVREGEMEKDAIGSQTTPEVTAPVSNLAKQLEEMKAQAQAARVPEPVDPIANKLAWQQSIFTKIRTTANDTTVNWLVADSVGKTNLAKHHCGDAITLRAPEHIWGYLAGAQNPTLNHRGYKEDHLEGKAFVFDNNSADFDYNLLFDIKDGFISSESQGPKQFTAPNVWVLSRVEPRVLPENIHKFTQWKVVNGELVRK